jgi:hypothetical protein
MAGSTNRLDKLVLDLKARVRKAISRGLISAQDIRLNNEKRLLNFIKFSLVEQIDRKTAIQILSVLDYDATANWDEWEETYGKITCIEDLAIISVMTYLKATNLDKYAAYVDEENKRIKYER